MNIASKELNLENIGRREFFGRAGKLGAFVLGIALSRKDAFAEPIYGQAAVMLSEKSIRIYEDPAGNPVIRETTVRFGNDYVLTPAQERGRERAQRVLVRIGLDGVGRERVKIMRRDGTNFWKDGGDTFVFAGKQDTEAPVYDSCDVNPCQLPFPSEYRPGMNIDAYRVRKGGNLEYFLTFPTAFDCDPRKQVLTDTIHIVAQKQQPSPPVPTPTPVPARPPVQLPPVQVPRRSDLSLGDEFGEAAYVEGNELGRVIYE